MLDRAAELQPTVLVLDDLHCADVATLEVLAYLCAALDRQRLAVVVAFRPDEVDEVLGEWLQDVRRAPHVIEAQLVPMTLVETRAQLTDLLGGDPQSVLGESLISRIHHRSGGNPYAAEALMRAALAGDEDTLPASLREVLIRRTRACTPGTAEVLRTVSAAGERVSPTLVAAVLAGSTAAASLDDSIDEAVRDQLLVVESDGSLSLRHALLAEALYADLLPGERRALHGRLLDALQQVPDARPGVVAEHADRAGNSRQALAWSLRAAQAAEEVYAYDEAHRQYDRVRRLWPAVPDAEALVGADAVDVFSRAASIAAICDHDVDAVEIIERVRSWLQADPDVDPVRLGLLEARYARFLLDGGRTDAALVAARRAVDLVPAHPPTPARGVVVSGLVHVLDWAGGSGDWEPLADEAVDIARSTGDGAAVARALVIRTTVQPGSPTLVQDAQEAVGLALADGDPELVGQTYSNLVDCLHCVDRGREGVEAAAAGVAAVTERGLGIRYGSWLSSQGAELALTYGWWDEAETFLTAALAHTRHIQGANRDYALVMRARLSSLRGEWDRLDADLADVHRLPAVLELLRCEVRAEAQLWRGDPDAALAMVAEYAGSATDRLLALSAPLAWLGSRALADVGDARRRTGSGAPGGVGWEETAAVVDDLVERACGPTVLPGWKPEQMRALCDAERSRHSEGGGTRCLAGGRQRPDHRRTAVPAGLCAVAAGPGAGRGAEPRRRCREPAAGRRRCPAAPRGSVARRDRGHRPAYPDRPPAAAGGAGGRHRAVRDADRARAGDPRAPRGRAHERRDRQGAGHQHEDGERARVEHPAEARRVDPLRGRRDRRAPPAGVRLAAVELEAAQVVEQVQPLGPGLLTGTEVRDHGLHRVRRRALAREPEPQRGRDRAARSHQEVGAAGHPGAARLCREPHPGQGQAADGQRRGHVEHGDPVQAPVGQVDDDGEPLTVIGARADRLDAERPGLGQRRRVDVVGDRQLRGRRGAGRCRRRVDRPLGIAIHPGRQECHHGDGADGDCDLHPARPAQRLAIRPAPQLVRPRLGHGAIGSDRGAAADGERHGAGLAAAVGVVDDAAELCEVRWPQVVGDVVHRLVGQPGERGRLDPEEPLATGLEGLDALAGHEPVLGLVRPQWEQVGVGELGHRRRSSMVVGAAAQGRPGVTILCCPLVTYGAHMTTEQGDGADARAGGEAGTGKPLPDGAHLDEDAEAMEDPVHSGDAIHQHEQHHPSGPSAG